MGREVAQCRAKAGAVLLPLRADGAHSVKL
jgi:hypothetical protein